MHLTLICKDRWVEFSSCTRSVSLTGTRSNIHHINLSLPTSLCCSWNIHWQHAQEQSWFSLYFRLQAERFLTSLLEWWEQNSLLFICLIVWWDPFAPYKTPEQHKCNVVLCGDKPYFFKSLRKPCRGRSMCLYLPYRLHISEPEMGWRLKIAWTKLTGKEMKKGFDITEARY